MDNLIDITFKKILKIASTLSIFKIIFYLVGGIIILVLNQRIEEYIYLIVGADLIITAFLEFIEEIVKRKYKRVHNHLASSLLNIIIGVLILTIFHNNVYKISVMWAVATVVTSTIEINEGLHEIHERKAFSIINLLFAITEIVFSIWLLIEPEENKEHFLTHVYLLGTGFVLESVESIFKLLYNLFKSKNKNKQIEENNKASK
ncbi:MAG: DUF308 domain-containing protein [Acholeplasmatales bacterium]|nr:DUF308 domain-containing protein [Acholeplasmatales bacterium]